MDTFKNVTLKKHVNSYFDGKVTSRSITMPDGSMKSLGVMLPGAYEFSTKDKEHMEIYSGDLIVKLPDSDVWINIQGGENFEVPANAKFQLKVSTLTDYCCSYMKA